MKVPSSLIACDIFRRHEAAIERLGEAMGRAQTDLGRRELATAMCVKANELLNCRERSPDQRECAICDRLVVARREAVAEFIMEHAAAVGADGAVRPVRAVRSRPRGATAPRTAS